MGVAESIFYMVWRGLAIGVLISAPMGPVGIMCIQRTLVKGRKAGFYTGIGAAISDLFYCLLTGFGLSFIEEFLERNHNVIQLLGSLVLIGFSVYLFRKSPSESLKQTLPDSVSAKKNILGGFLFTFSNPLILFLIIGLFARFNFNMPEIKFYHYMIGFIFILIGALGWWYGVTYAIDKVRSRFSLRTMKVINVTIGIVILLFALVGIVSSIGGLTSTEASAATIKHWNARRGWSPLSDENTSDITLSNRDKAAEAAFYVATGSEQTNPTLRFSFTATPYDLSRRKVSLTGGRKDAQFGIICRDAHSDKEYFVAIAISADMVGDYIPERECVASGKRNTFKFSTFGGKYQLSEGGKKGRILSNGYFPDDFSIDSIGFLLSPGVALQIDNITLEIDDTPEVPKGLALQTPDSLRHYLSETTDILEGEWSVMEYSLDESLLRQGGDYRVAIIKSPRKEGRYDILYLEGAEVNKSAWRPLMLKGSLDSSDIADIYDICWIDAFGAKMDKRLKAQQEDENTLTLYFPAQGSTLKLRKLVGSH